MTLDPDPSSLSVALSSGRVVEAGAHLSVAEAQDLVILQRGMAPLRPVAISAVMYVLTLPGAVTPDMALAEVFTGALPLIVDRQAAETAYDLHIDVGRTTPVPVPIGGGQFVLQDFDDMTSEALNAALEWQTTWWDREMHAADLAIEASKTRPGQA